MTDSVFLCENRPENMNVLFYKQWHVDIFTSRLYQRPVTRNKKCFGSEFESKSLLMMCCCLLRCKPTESYLLWSKVVFPSLTTTARLFLSLYVLTRNPARRLQWPMHCITCQCGSDWETRSTTSETIKVCWAALLLVRLMEFWGGGLGQSRHVTVMWLWCNTVCLCFWVLTHLQLSHL